MNPDGMENTIGIKTKGLQALQRIDHYIQELEKSDKEKSVWLGSPIS